jgi:hypothetical protein
MTRERVDDATINKFIQAGLPEAIPYEGSGIDVGFFGRFLVQEGGKAALILMGQVGSGPS